MFTLAAAECELEFEHRDLHWGNVLVRTTTQAMLPCRVKGVDILLRTQGMQVALIDFTASRLRTQDGSLAYCDLAQDPDLFSGPKKHVQVWPPCTDYICSASLLHRHHHDHHVMQENTGCMERRVAERAVPVASSSMITAI